MAKAKATPAKKQEVITSLEAWLADGKTLRDFCRQEGVPAWRTVYDWIEADPDFAARIARARIIGADAIAQECLEIADDGRNDWMEKYGRDGEQIGWQLNGEHVQRSKLRVESRLKLLAKWFPKQYGDRVALAGDKDAPLEVNSNVLLTDVPLDSLYKIAAGKLDEGDAG